MVTEAQMVDHQKRKGILNLVLTEFSIKIVAAAVVVIIIIETALPAVLNGASRSYCVSMCGYSIHDFIPVRLTKLITRPYYSVEYIRCHLL